MGRRSVIRNTTPPDGASAAHKVPSTPRKSIATRLKQILGEHAPVGYDITPDCVLYVVGLGLAWFISVGFWVDLQNTLDEFSRVSLSAGQSLAMPSFVALLGNYMILFPFLTVLCLGLIPRYYLMHYGESRSVYLMRRLPKRWALHHRCITLPLCMAGLTLLVGGLLLAFYYHCYCKLTPTALWQDGQLTLLWQTWFC